MNYAQKAGLPESVEDLTKSITRGFIVELLNVVIINPIIQVGTSLRINLSLVDVKIRFFKKSNQSPLGDVAHIQIPAPPSLRNWYRRRMRHEERLKVLNFSPNVVLLLPNHFISALNNSYLSVLSDHGQSLPNLPSRCFPGWHHKHLPSSNAASRPRFPKPELQKVCKSLPQARTLPWCLSGFERKSIEVGRSAEFGFSLITSHRNSM